MTADVALAMLVSGGVNPTIPVHVAPPLSVTPPESGWPERETSGLDGAATVTVAGAFPLLARTNIWLADDTPTSDAGKAIVPAGDFNATVAPVGVTVSGT